jgi:DNA-binding NarL/FixJ family response regulator
VRRSFALLWGDSRYLMAPGSFTIGRSSTCDLVVDDPRVSRVHATILVGIDSAIVQDAGSHNGVYVNDRRIEGSQPLVDGDRLTIASAQLSVSSTERGATPKSRDQTMPSQQLAAVARAREPADAVVQDLSAREREVLVLIAHGHTMREVAEQLGLSPKTVEGYRARVVDKLGLRTRAEIVQFALRNGLLRA